MFCTQCANQMVDGDRFCAQCGHPASSQNKTEASNSHKQKNKQQPVEGTSSTTTSKPKGKISVQQVLQDPEAQPFVEPLQNACAQIADRITDYLPFVYFAQFMSVIDLLTEAGQKFESGEFGETEFLDVYDSVLENADFTDAMEAYRQSLNEFPLTMAQQYNFLLETLVNNNVDDAIMKYALGDNQLKAEADKLQAALGKPAAGAATALKAVVAAYPRVMQQLQKANIDFNNLQASQETMENSELWSYAQGLVTFAASPALGAMSLMRTFSRQSEKDNRVKDRVAGEVSVVGESIQAYTGSLFDAFSQLHDAANVQFEQFCQALMELYAKPFLLARHVGSIEDWETLGDAANAIIGGGIYEGLIDGDDETFDEIVGRSRELMQALREEAEAE